MELKDGEPCKHPGCLNHVTHPCEGCGRIAGRRTAPTSEPVAWISANQKSFVHNLDIGDSVPNWTDYYTIPLYTSPQPCSRCAETSLFWMEKQAEAEATIAALEAENKRLHYFPKNDVFRTAEVILSDCGCSTEHTTLLEKVRSRLFAMFDKTIAQQAERIRQLENAVAFNDKTSQQYLRERTEARQQVQRQAAVIEKCRYALDHYMYGGSNYRKPAEEALAAIKELKNAEPCPPRAD